MVTACKIFTHKQQPQYEIALKNRRKWNTFSFIDKKTTGTYT